MTRWPRGNHYGRRRGTLQRRYAPRVTFAVPAALVPGDLVAVVAPSSPFPRGELWRGLAWLRARYRRADLAGRVWRGTATSRVTTRGGGEELAAALSRPGGQGRRSGARGLRRHAHPGRPALGGARQRPKWIVGFSDVTALHAMAWRHAVASVHGPNVTGLGVATLAASCARPGWRPSSDPARPRLAGPARHPCGRARAASSSGATCRSSTRWRPPGGSSCPEGAVLAVEDVTEAPYRIDRMLTSLALGGHLARASALVFGGLRPMRAGSRRTVPSTRCWERLGRALGIPVLAGAPFGHGPHNEAFVVGRARASDRRRGLPQLRGRGGGMLRLTGGVGLLRARARPRRPGSCRQQPSPRRRRRRPLRKPGPEAQSASAVLPSLRPEAAGASWPPCSRRLRTSRIGALPPRARAPGPLASASAPASACAAGSSAASASRFAPRPTRRAQPPPAARRQARSVSGPSSGSAAGDGGSVWPPAAAGLAMVGALGGDGARLLLRRAARASSACWTWRDRARPSPRDRPASCAARGARRLRPRAGRRAAPPTCGRPCARARRGRSCPCRGGSGPRRAAPCRGSRRATVSSAASSSITAWSFGERSCSFFRSAAAPGLVVELLAAQLGPAREELPDERTVEHLAERARQRGLGAPRIAHLAGERPRARRGSAASTWAMSASPSQANACSRSFEIAVGHRRRAAQQRAAGSPPSRAP